CPAGRYGRECQNNCSGYCWNKEPCRFTTGVCLNGCSPGYDFKQDDKCKTECDKHYFGYNCNSTCHCEECENVNGYCGVYPCYSGWIGDTCSEQMESTNSA
ncbi:DRPR-like protein, partial [Mya arenaria]